MTAFLVDHLHYYQKKLVEQGMVPALKSCTPEAPRPASHALSAASSPRLTAWEQYCAAYILAGQRVAEIGRRQAALEASAKFNVSISPSTALRASQNPGQSPRRPGPETNIPSDVEHKLECLCLALREMNLPIFRFMIVNYVNTLIARTDVADKFKDREVRRSPCKSPTRVTLLWRTMRMPWRTMRMPLLMMYLMMGVLGVLRHRPSISIAE